MRSFITTQYRLILILILAFAFSTRLIRLHVPERYIFDEVYHVVTVKLIAKNDPRAYEWWNQPIEPNTAVDWLHPPLAKYTQAAFVKLLGPTSFAWRLSSALFGVGVIGLVYVLTQQLWQRRSISLLAAGLASLDGLLLVQSRIAMNDIHVTFFILLTLWCYLKFIEQHRLKWFVATALGAGLAMSSKWSGVFVLLVVGLTETSRLIQSFFKAKPKRRNGVVREMIINAALLIIIPAVLYLGSYTQMFLQGKNLDHLYKLHQQIWWYQTNLNATHTYQSRPWQWFLDLRPVWFHVDYTVPNKIGNVYAFGNPILFWLGGLSVIVSLGLLIAKKITRVALSPKMQKLSFVLLSYLAVWALWQFSPRIMFFYHYTPAVPLLCIILAYWLIQLFDLGKTANRAWLRFLAIGSVGLIALTFVIWYPHWTGIRLPTEWVNQVYFAIKSWH